MHNEKQPARRISPLPIRSLILVIALLLVGVFLRFYPLGSMRNMLNFDEAYDAIDAISLVHSPRLIAFFPDNGVRQSGWMYYLALWVAVGGAQPFMLRVATALVGVLTMAAVYALARRVVGRQSAVWSVGALGVLFWHAHLSHIILRAILLPLIGVLALALLFRAERTNRLRWWVIGGAFTGLTLYAYFSSVPWLGYIVLMLGWWFVRRPERRRGIAAALGVGALLAIPMAFYLLANFNQAASRPIGVAVLTPSTIIQNTFIWANAWFGQGSTIPQLNFPGRPILDIPLGILVIAGLFSLIVSRAQLQSRLWLLGLAAVSIAPSLFSQEAPHPLRAIGLVVPIALVAGCGACWLAERLRQWPLVSVTVPLLLIGWAGIDTGQAMQRWLRRPDVYVQMEQHVTEATSFILTDLSGQDRVYYSPFASDHPDVAFNQTRLAPRQVSGFDAHDCLVLADTKSIDVSLDMYDPDFQHRLAPVSDVSILHQDSVSPPHYRIYQVTPHSNFIAGWGVDEPGVFDHAVQVRLVSDLPGQVRPGDRLTVNLAFRALHPIDKAFNVFSHLYGQVTPYEGGKIWGQADSAICASHPPTVWAPDEIVIQPLVLTVAADTPAGTYTLAVGLYDLSTLVRLPLSNPPQKDNYYGITQLIVSSP